MQGSDTQNSSNVVSLFGKKPENNTSAVDAEANADSAAEKESFETVMERNMKNSERLRKERLNANKSVLRSYRIKN